MGEQAFHALGQAAQPGQALHGRPRHVLRELAHHARQALDAFGEQHLVQLVLGLPEPGLRQPRDDAPGELGGVGVGLEEGGVGQVRLPQGVDHLQQDGGSRLLVQAAELLLQQAGQPPLHRQRDALELVVELPGRQPVTEAALDEVLQLRTTLLARGPGGRPLPHGTFGDRRARGRQRRLNAWHASLYTGFARP
jgi:hypothetical protein